MIFKVLGPEVSIGTANTVSNSTLVRVVNIDATAVLNIGNYANVTVTNTESVIIEKSSTDTLTGANMLAAPIAYRY
jgi:hypothetical protein